MFSRTITGTIGGLALAGTVAALATIGSQAATENAGTAYIPMQAISHDLGSKSVVGYFIREVGACQVVLMIAENADPDVRPVPSAARLRLALEPGQMAGLDSEEGQSIDLSCDDNAATLTVFSRRTEDLAVVTN
jgi:hypothetical protein